MRVALLWIRAPRRTCCRRHAAPAASINHNIGSGKSFRSFQGQQLGIPRAGAYKQHFMGWLVGKGIGLRCLLRKTPESGRLWWPTCPVHGRWPSAPQNPDRTVTYFLPVTEEESSSVALLSVHCAIAIVTRPCFCLDTSNVRLPDASIAAGSQTPDVSMAWATMAEGLGIS